MKCSSLITDAGTGQLSHTKIWANIAYIVATVAFLRQVFFAPVPPDADIWLIYLGVIGSHCAVSKLISLRYRAQAGYQGEGWPYNDYRDGRAGRDELGG